MKDNKGFKLPIKTTLALLMLQAFNANALITLTDTDFPTLTGISASTDDVLIQTSDSISAPQITVAGGNGLSVNNGKTMTIDSAAKFGVTLTGNGMGIRVAASDANDVTFHAKSELEINMVGGRGLFLGGTGSTLGNSYGEFDQKVTINATGNNAIGAFIYGKGHAEFRDALVINMSGNNSYGLALQWADPGHTDLAGLFDEKVTINMTGNAAKGITSQATPGGVGTVDAILHFKNGLDVETQNGTAIESITEKSHIIIDGQSRIVSNDIAGNGYNAIEVLGGVVSVNGQSTIQGNIEAITDSNFADAGTVNLNLQSGSTITGKMDNYTTTTLPSGYSQGVINLDFQGTGSDWTLTDNSYINSLKGTGHFHMTTDIESNSATVLYITDAGAAMGNHTVSVTDTGTGNVSETHEQLVISTNGGDAHFSMPTLANIGAYQYDIKKKPGNGRDDAHDWVLSQSTNLSDSASAAINDVRASYLMNFAETQTLLQRLGELKYQSRQDYETNLWARTLFGKFDVDTNGPLSGFDQKFTGIQIGGDKLFDLSEAERLYLGGTFGYTNSDQSYQMGSGEIDSYYVGVYGTYINDNGLYVDNFLKFGLQDQSFKLRDNQGKTVSSDTDNRSITWSTEVGYQAYLNQETQDGFYLEPQGQLTLGYVSSDDFTTSNGMKVKFDSYNIALGRLGLLGGYTIKSDENPINIYAKASYVHEFGGNLKSNMNGDDIQTDLGSSWWTYGLGANANINTQHNFYADIERSSGADFKQLWKLNVGYRFAF